MVSFLASGQQKVSTNLEGLGLKVQVSWSEGFRSWGLQLQGERLRVQSLGLAPTTSSNPKPYHLDVRTVRA